MYRVLAVIIIILTLVTIQGAQPRRVPKLHPGGVPDPAIQARAVQPHDVQQLGTIWTLPQGPLPSPQQRVTDAFPLSDQGNKGGWVLNPAMSDEFEGGTLDLSKWTTGLMATADGKTGPWNGRQPSLFIDQNVAVGTGPSGTGNLKITVRKDPTNSAFISALQSQGYNTYTSGIVHTKARGGDGYYEIKAKPMYSSVSSACWFQQEDQTQFPNWVTEIDVFEIGGNATGFPARSTVPYCQWLFMTTHVFQTPTKGSGWSVDWHQGGWWISPIKFADDYHIYGLERNKDRLTWYFDGVPVQTLQNIYFHQPQWLILDGETTPNWFGLPADADLPSTFNIEYVRSWTKPGGSTGPTTGPQAPVITPKKLTSSLVPLRLADLHGGPQGGRASLELVD